MKRLVVDIESTGLSPNIHKVLTVGLLLIDVDIEDLKIIDEKHIKVYSAYHNVDPIALSVNKINLEKHNEEALQPIDACKEIYKFISEHDLTRTPLLGHNVNFDLRFLEALHQQAKYPSIFYYESIDTISLWLSMKNLGLVPLEYKSSLKVLANFFNISYEGAHDALFDCHITAQVYYNLLRMMRENGK
ncbi:hypothetical protein CMI37_38425 [Candidatus Pacearchaeota archaeon]|nr:hypothetical protein [Candidatus Pacearchaeota archaeon]|tara:strand:+ start:843 stop:1409 length:567 start_codon:yes stop_codon:yes gene_type:complete